MWIKTAYEANRALTEALEHKVVFVDTETTGLDPHTLRLLLISLHYGDTTVVLDMTALQMYQIHENLARLLQQPETIKVFHNAVYDMKVFYTFGITTYPAACTYVTEQILQAGYVGISCSLAATALRRTGVTLKKTTREEFISFNGVITEEQIDYAAMDVRVLPQVYAQQLEEINQQGLGSVYELEMDNLEATMMMEFRGIEIDSEKLKQSQPAFERLLKSADTTLQNEVIRRGLANQITFDKNGYSVINTASVQQMSRVFDEFGIHVKSLGVKDLAEWDSKWASRKAPKHPVGNPGLSAGEDQPEINTEDIDELNIGFQHPLLRAHAVRVAAEKILKTYVVGLQDSINPVTKKIHPQFRQCGAMATGRYSSSNPNFQNIVKKSKLDALGLGEWDIRSMFKASEGYTFIICDYNAIELVITACYAHDEVLLDQISRGDVHSYVATYLFGVEVNAGNKETDPYKILRDCAKTATYAILYGTTGRNLERSLATRLSQAGIAVRPGDGDRWIANWKLAFKVAGNFLQHNADSAVTRGYVTTVLGRRRRWNLHFENQWQFFAAQREGSNSAIQGSSADMMKLAIRNLYRTLKARDPLFINHRIAATIHDELLVEVRTDLANEIAKLTQYEMVEAGYTLFPLAREYGIIKADPKLSDRYNK